MLFTLLPSSFVEFLQLGNTTVKVLKHSVRESVPAPLRRHIAWSLVFVFWLSAVPLGFAQNGSGKVDDHTQKNTADAPKVAPAPVYIIQPNDLLEIFVWKEPDLTRKVLVRPDGRISFPLVQDMQAAGISPGQLKAAIEENLKEYLGSPNVTVIVEAIQSYRIYVTGKVQKPGAISAEKPLTVLQALALAGGFQEFANQTDITVIRSSDTRTTMSRVNYEELLKGKNLNQNILLNNGDVVVVP
jgi:polysaccharide export outer membrane protein